MGGRGAAGTSHAAEGVGIATPAGLAKRVLCAPAGESGGYGGTLSPRGWPLPTGATRAYAPCAAVATTGMDAAARAACDAARVAATATVAAAADAAAAAAVAIAAADAAADGESDSAAAAGGAHDSSRHAHRLRTARKWVLREPLGGELIEVSALGGNEWVLAKVLAVDVAHDGSARVRLFAAAFRRPPPLLVLSSPPCLSSSWALTPHPHIHPPSDTLTSDPRAAAHLDRPARATRLCGRRRDGSD